MDRLGLLAAVVAVTLYPGGAFAGLAGLIAGRRLPRLDAWAAWTPGSALGGVAVLVAASLLPLPGSPAGAIPEGGAPSNLLGLLVLLAAGAALCVTTPAPDGGGPGHADAPSATAVPPRRRGWRWRPTPGGLQVTAIVVAAVPLLALTAEAATLASGVVAGLGAPRLAAARALAAAALVLSAPLAIPDDGGAPAAAPGLALGVALLLAAAIAEPGGLAARAGAISGLYALGIVALGGWLAVPIRRWGTAALGLAVGLAVAATVLALAGS